MRLGLVAAGDEIEGLTLGETFRACLAQAAPLDREGVEQADEEFRARLVHVAMGDGDGRKPSTLTTSTWASVVPMSFWMMRRLSPRTAVVSSPG